MFTLPFPAKFSLQRYLFKRLKRENKTELTARRIYILPSREGMTFAIVIFLLLSGAMNYNNSLLFIYTFLLAGMGIITMYHTHNNLLHVVCHAVATPAVFAGEKLHVPVQLFLKPGQTNTRYSLELKLANIKFKNKKDRLKTDEQNQYFDLQPAENRQACFIINTEKRGYTDPPELILASRYPFGLLRAWSNLLLEQKYLVYPRPLSKAALEKINFSSEDGKGDTGKGFDEFKELREKQPSDSYTHVHWKAYARNETMLVKQYGGSVSENIFLRWDDFPQFDTEKRLSLLCRLLIDASQQQQIFSLQLPGELIPPGTGKVHLHQCLKALALFPATSEAGL